jgi:hypothetical protein
MQYKSTKDVEESVDKVVETITIEKNKTEKEFENLVTTIDNKLQDADLEIDNTVIELNTNIGLTEKNIISKKEIFSQKLHNSLSLYKKSVDDIKNNIDNELKYYTLVLAFLFFFYDITITWLFQMFIQFRPTEWPLLFDGLSVDNLIFTGLKICIIVYVIYRMWMAFNQINKKINKKYIELRDES